MTPAAPTAHPSRRRRLLLGLGAPLVALVAALGWLARGLPRSGAERIVVDDRVTGVLAGSAYAWVLHAGGHTVLVDAGDDPEARAIDAELARLGIAPTEVEAILLTHAHGDHLNGAAAFANAVVHSGDGDRALIGGYKLPRALIARLTAAIAARLHGKLPPPAQVRTVLPGGLLRFGELEVEVIAVPGHSMGSVAYRLGDVLFTGDSLVPVGDRVDTLPGLFNDRTSLLRRSLHRLAGQPFTAIAAGHGGLVADGRARFERWLEDNP